MTTWLMKNVWLLALLPMLLSACTFIESPQPTPTPSSVSVLLFFPKLTENDVTFVPVERTVPGSHSVAEATIKELLKGPTASERAQGLSNPIPESTQLRSLSFRDRIAYADFDKQMEYQMGGSLRVMTIRQMIIQTLKQFPDVRDVVISVEDRTEDILQP